MNFYDKLKSICSQYGTSPTAVATKAGMSNSIVSSWKKGASPTETTLKKLAAVLGVSLSDLVDEEQQIKQSGILMPVVNQKTLGVDMHIAYYNIKRNTEMIAAMRFEDDSMIPRVYPGVIAIYDKTELPQNGDYAVVRIGEEKPTIRLYVEIDDIVSILPMSTEYQGKTFPKTSMAAACVTIIGKVIEFRREL